MTAGYQCSVAAGERGEPLFATGSRVRGWLLIEVRGAWGDDAIHDSAFGEHVPRRWKDGLKRQQIRAVCIRSHLRTEATAIRLFACAARRPGRGSAPLYRRDVDSLAEVVPAAGELAIDATPGGEWERVAERLILVCTNGRHDQCCANLGRPLVRALRDSPWAAQLWECSHIGGDRFAPNVVVLPDSLYFGRVWPEAAAGLLRGIDEARLDLDRFRGRTSLSLTEQAVEHFVRREFGVDTLDGLSIDRRAADGAYPVTVGDRTVLVRVRRRMVAVEQPLTCKGESGRLVPEFTLESIR